MKILTYKDEKKIKEITERLRTFIDCTAWIGIEDRGTCVLGNGIAVNYIPKGKRKPREIMLVTNGELGYQCELEEILKDYIEDLQSEFGDYFIYKSGTMN